MFKSQASPLIRNTTLLGILVPILLLILQSCAEKPSLKWHHEVGYRWAELSVPELGAPGFQLLPASETGVVFSNSLTRDQITENRLLLGGSGVATGDVDGDGLPDIYFCGLGTANVLYKNLGDWKFKDVTDEAGIVCSDRFSTAATFADIDGDTDLDLLVTALGGPNACFMNDGSGRFTEVTAAVGLTSDRGSTSMALADIDGDGDLDLYVTNLKKISVESIYPPQQRRPDDVTRKVGETYEVIPEFREHYRVDMLGDQAVLLEKPEPDALYLNDGSGHFNPASLTDGRFLDEDGNPVSELMDWGLLPRFQDIDNDGDADIYICNDYWSPDRIWVNDGTGRFKAINKLAIRHTSKFTMALDFSDIDRDGDLDFILVDMLAKDRQRRRRQLGMNKPVSKTIGQFDDRPQIKRNTLFLNRGDNSYAEIGLLSGIQASDWTWSARFLDVDLDGYEDIITTNGQLYDLEDTDTNDRVQRLSALGQDHRQLTFLYPNYLTPNTAFRNNGDLKFEDVSTQWGFKDPDLAWGMAFADFDLDGDLDIATNRLNDPAGIYRNEVGAQRIAVRLRGLPSNTQGIGAKIHVLGGPVPQQKEVICGGTYLSGSDPISVFAAGDRDRPLTIEVHWHSGKITQIGDALPNRLYEIFEPDSATVGLNTSDQPITQNQYFEDVSHLIDHVHHEDRFDDFQRQPLLPKRLSQLGPGIAWVDIDGDGDDDLFVTTGKGGKLAGFRNNGSQGFFPMESSIFNQKSQHEQTALLGWSPRNGLTSLLVACSNYEDPESEKSFVQRYDLTPTSQSISSRSSLGFSSVGPMSMADYDNDGDLDLFVGGRAIPGRYPEPASSIFYRNDGNNFQIDIANSNQLRSVGLVSGSVFSDIDADGDSDLILAMQWGPVMIFRNNHGTFENVTRAMGLDQLVGLWSGVTCGDLDEDGRLDIVATNWGLNHEHHSAADSLSIYYGDFDRNGTIDVVQAYFEPFLNKMLPVLSLHSMMRGIPYISSKTPTYKSFSDAGVNEVIGESFTKARKLQVNTFEHTAFLNRGDGFEPVPFPNEAQFAPAFYVGVADFDGDGHEDIFISQNFFATHPEAERHDAGRGLWLKGDGTGALRAVAGQESGIEIYGEQRGAALGDYDRDGRVDLVVTQNGSTTKLYRNTGAKPGLRVRLIGLKGNPLGIGASIRMIYKNGSGPAREIHAGSGYWSQDSAVQIMGLREKPIGISVCWPGGKVTNSDLPKKVREITIDRKGNIAVLD